MLDEENEILALAGKDEIHAARGRNRGLRRDEILPLVGLGSGYRPQYTIAHISPNPIT